ARPRRSRPRQRRSAPRCVASRARPDAAGFEGSRSPPERSSRRARPAGRRGGSRPGAAPPGLQAGAWDGCSAHIGRKGRTARRERRLVSAWSSRGLGYQLGRGAMTKGCGPDWSLTIAPIRYVLSDETNRLWSETRDYLASPVPPLATRAP